MEQSLQLIKEIIELSNDCKDLEDELDLDYNQVIIQYTPNLLFYCELNIDMFGIEQVHMFNIAKYGWFENNHFENLVELKRALIVYYKDILTVIKDLL